MITKIKEWFKRLSNSSQLIVLFISWFIYWILFELLFDAVWPDDEPETYTARILQGVWMAIWMTTLSNWKKVKLLFSCRSFLL